MRHLGGPRIVSWGPPLIFFFTAFAHLEILLAALLGAPPVGPHGALCPENLPESNSPGPPTKASSWASNSRFGTWIGAAGTAQGSPKVRCLGGLQGAPILAFQRGPEGPFNTPKEPCIHKFLMFAKGPPEKKLRRTLGALKSLKRPYYVLGEDGNFKIEPR